MRRERTQPIRSDCMMVQSVIEIPQEPFLVKLFEHWQRSPTATIIRDRRDDDGDFTIERLLFDIHAVQKELYGSLDDEAKTRLSHPDDEVFIAIVAPGGYRYCVLFLAVYYLGATAMPLCESLGSLRVKIPANPANSTEYPPRGSQVFL